MTFTSPRHRRQDTQGGSRRTAGFTLIELLIVVAIIGILASIAYPSYPRYVEDARRTDGQSGLMQAAQQLERCYTVRASYVDCPFSSSSPDEIYTITVERNASTFTLMAATTQPDRCANDLTLNHQGVRGPDECWYCHCH